MDDVLVIGAGPAGVAIAAALAEQGLRVTGIAPQPPDTPWANTYASWVDDAMASGADAFLSKRWADCVVFAGDQELPLQREYGLYDNLRLQAHLLLRAEKGGASWQIGRAARVVHQSTHAVVHTRDGNEHCARLVIDASGHRPVCVQRPAAPTMAYQAAYGVVGTFSRPPVRDNQLVVMDYRAEHLSPAERTEPPTFLYAMNLGNGQYFVEETSLAHAPGMSLSLLERRLHQRLAAQDIRVEETQHIERCFFPMNPPLPDRHQLVVGFGAAASMVHPPSGYLVSRTLHMAPILALTIARSLGQSGATPVLVARAAWQALWPRDRVQQHALYRFCLASLLRCDAQQTSAFFRTFFQLPYPKWSGYFSGTLSTRELCATMLQIFVRLPPRVQMILAKTAMFWWKR